MPQVGTRKTPKMGSMTKDPMYAYAKAFLETQQNMMLTASGTTNETSGNLSRRRNDVWDDDEEDYDY